MALIISKFENCSGIFNCFKLYFKHTPTKFVLIVTHLKKTNHSAIVFRLWSCNYSQVMHSFLSLSVNVNAFFLCLCK